MAKAHKQQFIPVNRKKYIGPNIDNIVTRSSWEFSVCNLLDQHPWVTAWASEAIRIPYFNPFSRRGSKIGDYTFYVPDFFIVYTDRNKVEHKEVVEVKPSQEMPGYPGKVSKLVEARQALNLLKWKAAVAFCAARNWRFRVATEVEMFAFNRNVG